MKKITLILFGLLLNTLIFSQSHQIEGEWFNEEKDAIITIEKGSDNSYFGKITWMKFPNDENGNPKTDPLNDDENLRSRSRLGMKIMYDCDDMWNTLCPMHLRLDSAGVIVHVGPTLAKLQAGSPFCGQDFQEVFTLLGTHADLSVVDLLARPQAKLSLRLLAGPKLALKGVLVPTRSGAILNLSFGISIVTAVREYALTGADFAATDLAMEMLYLVEAKSVAMGESRKLNARLQETTLAEQLKVI